MVITPIDIGSIGNVENRPKKFKIFAAPKWNPRWEMGIGDQGKIKHIHHLAM